jgi:pimeloyl-ACP methyl ester carboxylesterase
MTPIKATEHWLLLRGLGREAAHWGDFPAALAESLMSIETHALDLPGSGVHWREHSPCSVAAMALSVRGDAQSFLATPRPKCFVLAMSLGAMVAIEWMQRWPQEIDGAVLINASAGGLNRPWQRLRPLIWWPLGRTLLSKDPLTREQRIHRMTCNRSTPHVTFEERAAIYRSRPFQSRNLIRQLLAASRFRLPDQGLTVPILLLASAADRFVNPACSVAMQQALAARLVLHDSANHDLPFDDPHWVIEQIIKWRATLAL